MDTKYNVFISYSRKDLELVKKIKAEIDRLVGIDCWMDLDGIESGEQFEDVIINALCKCDTILFMMSANSMLSEWALDELEFAMHEKKRIVLVSIDNAEMSGKFYFRYHKYDTITWSNQLQREKLIRNLKSWIDFDDGFLKDETDALKWHQKAAEQGNENAKGKQQELKDEATLKAEGKETWDTVAPSQYDIFISYRRVGGKEYARMLKPELEKRGFKVFLDFDELDDGIFDKRIKDAINSSPVFLLILSKGALDRCMNDGDWVREEILYADKCHCHIIPVEFDKSFREVPKTTPHDISEIIGAHSWAQIDTETLLQESIDKMVQKGIHPYVRHRVDNNLLATKPSQDGMEVRIDARRKDIDILESRHVGNRGSQERKTKNTEKGESQKRLKALEEKKILYEHFVKTNSFIRKKGLLCFWACFSYIPIIGGVVLIWYEPNDFWWFIPTLLSFALLSITVLSLYIYHSTLYRRLQLTKEQEKEFTKQSQREYEVYKELVRKKRLGLLSDEEHAILGEMKAIYKKRQVPSNFDAIVNIFFFIAIIAIWIYYWTP